MYCIRSLCHRTDISMGVHGFCIDLSPRFKELVAASAITQENINYLLGHSGRTWLDATGYDAMFDPENCGAWADPEKPPSPRARPLYEPTSLRVAWGEWGPEHISVPGNACGLDLDRQGFGLVFEGGSSLVPHNVDSLSQKYLLLIVFTEIAEAILMKTRLAKRKVVTLDDVVSGKQI